MQWQMVIMTSPSWSSIVNNLPNIKGSTAPSVMTLLPLTWRMMMTCLSHMQDWKASILIVHIVSRSCSALTVLDPPQLLEQPLTTRDPGCPSWTFPPSTVTCSNGQFWEQLQVSVHHRSSLSNAEKLVYLQQVIKD